MAITGKKYDKALSRQQVAACIRADIKAAVAEGNLPPGSYSAACGTSNIINITVRNFEQKVQIFCDERVFRPTAKVPDGFRYSHAGKHILATLEGLGNAYRQDDTSIIQGRYEANFYLDVKFAERLLDADRADISKIPCCERCGGWMNHVWGKECGTNRGTRVEVAAFLEAQQKRAGWDFRLPDGYWQPPEQPDLDEDYEVLRRLRLRHSRTVDMRQTNDL